MKEDIRLLKHDFLSAYAPRLHQTIAQLANSGGRVRRPTAEAIGRLPPEERIFVDNITAHFDAARIQRTRAGRVARAVMQRTEQAVARASKDSRWIDPALLPANLRAEYDLIAGLQRGRVRQVQPGAPLVFRGTIVVKEPRFGFGGEAPPSGAYLRLDQPVKVGGFVTRELFLGGRQFPKGAQVSLHGSVLVRSWGGTETAGAEYLLLAYATDTAKREPRYVNGQWRSDLGVMLPRTLVYNNPAIEDEPSLLIVVDRDNALIGTAGGLLPPHLAGFHGFHRTVLVERPNVADQAAVRWDGDAPESVLTGETLTKVGAWASPKMSWYLAPATGIAYGFAMDSASPRLHRVIRTR
jgi:hypothetical protein